MKVFELIGELLRHDADAEVIAGDDCISFRIEGVSKVFSEDGTAEYRQQETEIYNTPSVLLERF